jgi:hypothetical protein
MRIEILDENENVINVIVATEEFAAANYEEGFWRIAEEQDEPVAPPIRPKLHVIAANSSNESTTLINEQFDEVTCFEGTVITFTTELRNPFDESVIPLTQMFRMPVRSRDNREFLVLVNMINGVASVPITFNNSGVWSATEETLNSNLNEEEKISFTGIKVFVVQS